MAHSFEVPDRRREQVGFWLYTSHLLAIFSVSFSNVLLGLTLLALPWTRRRPMPWAKLKPLWLFLGLYVLLFGGAIVASYEIGTSARGLTEVFNLSTLFVAPFVLRREGQVRRVVDLVVGMAALLACHGLSQYLFGYGDIDRRIRGPFSHYMTFSGFLLICDLLLVASMVYAGRWRSPLAVGSAGGDQRRPRRQLHPKRLGGPGRGADGVGGAPRAAAAAGLRARGRGLHRPGAGAPAAPGDLHRGPARHLQLRPALHAGGGTDHDRASVPSSASGPTW